MSSAQLNGCSVTLTTKAFLRMTTQLLQSALQRSLQEARHCQPSSSSNRFLVTREQVFTRGEYLTLQREGQYANIYRHYVAFIRKDSENGEEPKWVLFNDEKVVEAYDVEEMRKFAYVYFFKRR